MGDDLTDTLISHGVPGFALKKHERVALIVEAVGGMTRAAEIADVATDTVNKWRKEGAKLPLDGMLALCIAAGVSLDWIATGYHNRPDASSGVAETGASMIADAPGLIQLMPLRPQLEKAPGGRQVERWDPSPFAVREDWVRHSLGISPDHLRYAWVPDDDMAPAIPKSSHVLVHAQASERQRPGLVMVDIGGELVPRQLNILPDGTKELVAGPAAGWRYPLPTPAPALFRILWVMTKVDR